jgi:glycosyltransferase involved in cell wall biosynthesis
MKIAIVTTNFPRWEGDFRVPFIFDAAKAIYAKGHEVRIITTHQPGAAEYENMQGLEVFRVRYLPERWEVLQKDAAGLPSAWKKSVLHKLAMMPFFGALCIGTAKHARGFDIIHANWSLSGLAAYLTQSLHHCPYIVTVHGSDIFQTLNNPLLNFSVKIALKNANHIIAVSNALAEAVQACDISPNKITVVPTGIDISKFPMGKIEGREKALLYVGSLIERKGVIYLLRAMLKLRQEYPFYKLLIVGEGHLQKELEEFVNAHHLGDRVTFLGTKSQSEVANLMRRAKVLILPSTEEGQGAVLVEAMASGTPCVGSDIGGIPNVITPQTGRLFESANPDALYEAVAFILNNEVFWKEASQQARARAVENYSWDNLVENIIDLYKHLLDNAL